MSDDRTNDVDANDDWAPLPAGELCGRPGEQVDLVKRAPPPAPPPPQQPPAPPKPLDPAAEQALLALKQKLAAAPAATSIIATVQHREQLAERKRKAPPPACAATLVHVDAPPPVAEPEPVNDPAPAATEIDARESEPWFKGLPATEQERLRARWWLVAHRDDGNGIVMRRRLQRALAYGALCFFVLSLLAAPSLGTVSHVPLMTAAGALAAGIAEICNGGRFVYALAGAFAFVVTMGVGVILQPISLMGLLIAAYGMGAIGMDGEMRRSGGFPDK